MTVQADMQGRGTAAAASASASSCCCLRRACCFWPFACRGSMTVALGGPSLCRDRSDSCPCDEPPSGAGVRGVAVALEPFGGSVPNRNSSNVDARPAPVGVTEGDTRGDAPGVDVSNAELLNAAEPATV
jgi:hypothetical protein